MAGVIALGCHALLLFSFRVETAAVPLSAAETTLDVDLVAAAPASPPAPVAPATPESPPPPPLPEVAPPPPTPPPPEPAPAPEFIPAPQPKPSPQEAPAHHEAAKPVHQSPPAHKIAPPAPATSSGAATTGVPGGVTSPLRPRSNPKPPYPPEARRLGQQGRVLLEVQVGADGRATGVSVKRSSGFPALDNAAVQGVQRWTFEPARAAGLPVASRADVPVNFSLAQ